MPPAPRLRQLRRDNTLFKLAMNAIRLHLEEDDRLAQQPQLREAPDADLAFIQHSIDQWVGAATNYVAHKFRCPAAQAMQLLGELLAAECERRPRIRLPGELLGAIKAGQSGYSVRPVSCWLPAAERSRAGVGSRTCERAVKKYGDSEQRRTAVEFIKGQLTASRPPHARLTARV